MKNVIITGASSGIGKAIAEKLLTTNYSCINIDKTPPPQHSEIPYLRCDLTDAQQVNKLYTEVKKQIGVPHVLISNAGINVHEKLTEGDPEKWQEVFNCNVMGALRFIRAFINDVPVGGNIIFISSVAAHKAYEYGGVYSASKAAIDRIAETLRLEVQPDIKVSVVAPGTVKTEFFKNTINGSQQYNSQGWREVTSEQIAEYVNYILSAPESLNIDYSILRPSDQPF